MRDHTTFSRIELEARQRTSKMPLPSWFGMSVTWLSVPLNVVSSSWLIHADRSIQLHRVQYSIETAGVLAAIVTSGARRCSGGGGAPTK